ncbi:MAG TPA: biopolymer transporter ExbD [Chroococcales cyanobacterium]
MKFKSDSHNSEMPELNLVPMMDVLMTILTFFIIVSMTLTSQQSVIDVTLPSADAGANEQKNPDPLVVALNQQGQTSLSSQVVSQDQLAQQIVQYLNSNPQGAVVLKADSQLPYQKVIKVLGTMRDIGGDRVSLAIDAN